jgi:RNA polymerase sigma-B factor
MTTTNKETTGKAEMPHPDNIERDLFIKYRETKDHGARDLLICAYLPLVNNVSRRFTGLGESQSDLIQEGTIGLLNAVDHFNPDHGVKFITYATHLITSQIQHYLRDRGRLIRQPAWIQELNTKVTRAIKTLTDEFEREPTVDEVAAKLNLTVESINEVLAAKKLNKIVSLTAPQHPDDDNGLLVIDSSKIRSAQYKTLRLPIEDRIVMEEAINKLKLLEQRVVKLFFFGDMNQTEIAKKLGISTNYTSYLLHRSIDKLKNDLTEKPESPIPTEEAVKISAINVYDRITGLYSENYIRLRIKEEIERHERQPRVFSLVMISAENLPENHINRNNTLKSITTYLTRSVRTYDLLTSIGDGKFLLLMPQPRREAAIFSDRIAKGVKEKEWETPIVIKISIAAFPNDAKTTEDLINIVTK